MGLCLDVDIDAKNSVDTQLDCNIALGRQRQPLHSLKSKRRIGGYSDWCDLANSVDRENHVGLTSSWYPDRTDRTNVIWTKRI